MAATLHEIISRSKFEAAHPAKYSDFVLGPGSPADRRIAVDGGGWFPYCADGRLRKAMFVRTPENVDLSKASFVSLTQFKEACQVLVMSLEDLAELAATVRTPTKIIFVFSIGRCGSTLTAKILDQAVGTWSLSEPDIYAGLALTREEFSSDDVDLVISAGTRLLFAPASVKDYSTLSVKLRSQSLFQALDFHRWFPSAKFLFLYRDPDSWAKSYYHFMHSLGRAPVLNADEQRFIWMMLSGNADSAYLNSYLRFPQDSRGLYELLAPTWMLHLEAYKDCLEAGIPFHAVRYESYKLDMMAATKDILAHCDVQISDDRGLLSVFERHSQSGTFLDVPRSDDHFSSSRAAYFDIMKKSPRFDEIRDLVASDGLVIG